MENKNNHEKNNDFSFYLNKMDFEKVKDDCFDDYFADECTVTEKELSFSKSYLSLSYFFVLLVAILIILNGAFIFYEQDNVPKIHDCVLEIGTPFRLKLDYFVDDLYQHDNLSIDASSISDDTSIDPNTLEMKTRGYDFLRVGEYSINIIQNRKYNSNITYNTKLVVKDTISPIFKKISGTIHIDNTDDFVLSDYFEIMDYSETKIYLNEEDSLKIKKAGTHNVTVYAEDEFGNISYTSCCIYVKSMSNVTSKNEKGKSVKNENTVINNFTDDNNPDEKGKENTEPADLTYPLYVNFMDAMEAGETAICQGKGFIYEVKEYQYDNTCYYYVVLYKH